MERTMVFELEQDRNNTYRTYRFQEVVEAAPPVIGTLYVQKWAFETTPKQITVTIKAETATR